ncbi:MAG: UbiD family decarboxylase [Gammaproteobacteria bacterium]|nr:MAG: UbiD family decarboxylase [Gammaproteobacteria bacterium]
MTDLRSLTNTLEDRGDLVRISRQVDPRYEMPAVMAKLEAAGKAFLFEHVRGSPFPVAGGFFNRFERVALGLGVDTGGVSFTHDHLDGLIESAKTAPVPFQRVAGGPAAEIVHLGNDINLLELPVPHFFEHDSGPFITAAVGIARHPGTGVLNAGFYRALILDRDTCVINASSLSDLRRFYEHADQHGVEMPIALAIGVEPAVMASAACKLPPTVSEFDVAGGLKGRPVELMPARTSDLLVPAAAEIIIEGKVDFSRRVENVMGEYAGQYGPEIAPVTKVTAITHRRDPVFYSIMAGRSPEHNNIGAIAVYGIRRDIATRLQQLSPAIKRVNVFTDARLGPMVHIAIAMDKTTDDEPRELIHKAFGLSGSIFPLSRIARRIVVVDTDVDTDSLEDIEWAIWTRVAEAEKVIVIPNVESWELDRASVAGRGSMRIGIDATMDAKLRTTLARPIIPGADQIDLASYINAPGVPRMD